MALMYSDTTMIIKIRPEFYVAGPPPPGIIRVDSTTVKPYLQKIILNTSAALVKGPVVFLMKQYFKRMKVEPVLIAAGDRPWGVPQPNGTYSGKIGDIWSGRLDMMPGPVTKLYQRHDMFYLTHRYYHLTDAIIAWTPRKIVEPFGFVSTFQPNVWALTLFSMIFLAVVCALFAKILSGHSSFKVSPNFAPQQFFIFFTTLMGQSFQQRMRLSTWWYSLVFVMWFGGRFFLVTNFTSEMMNMMLMRKLEFTVSSIEDILKRKYIEMHVANGTNYEYDFRKPFTPLQTRLSSRMRPSPGISIGGGPLLAETMEKIERRQAVIYAPIETAKTIITRWMIDNPSKGCSTKLSPISSPISFATLMNKTISKEYKRIAEDTIKRLEESHIITKHTDLYLKGFRDCSKETKGVFETTSLGLQELAGVFFVLFVGLVASLLSFFLEICVCTRLHAAKRR